MTATTAAFVASTPVRYWPLNETSGTTATDLIASEVGTCSGMVMGGTDAPTGTGGKAPLFTGNVAERIVLRAGAILGGSAAWSVAAWVKYNVAANDEANRRFYGEANPTAGNDQLAAGVNGGASAGLRILYGNDAQAPQDLGASSLYIDGIWAFIVLTRSAGQLTYWYNLGNRTFRPDGNALNTWTDASVQSWVGNLPRTGASTPWKGSIAHLALYNRVLSPADQKLIYEASTPLTRTLINQEVFTATGNIWKQRLDEPSNPPTIASNSGTLVSKLVAQAAQYTGGTNQSTGPFWIAHNTDPTERVRILGGQENITTDHPNMYNGLGLFKKPTGFAGGGAAGESEATVWNVDTGQLWEFFGLAQTLTANSIFSAPSGAGTVPAGSHSYFVAGANASNQTGRIYFTTAVSVNGSQGVSLVWTEIENIDHYAVYRDGRLIATTAPGVKTLLDTGLALGAVYPGATAVTTDWGTLAAGYIADTTTSVGAYVSPQNNWGVAGSGLPLWGGSVSIMEARAGVIPHALALGLPEVDVTTRVYPALRNDGSTYPNSIPEATRFRLKPATVITGLPRMEQMCAQALKTYGGYVRDVTGEVSVYTEEEAATGRGMWFEQNEGRYDYELFSSFPWDQMEVVDPAWTQAQTTAVVDPDLFEELTETFASSPLDPAKWSEIGAGVTVTGGRAVFDVNPTYNGIFRSIATTHYQLTASHIGFQVPVVPSAFPGSEGIVSIFNQVDPNCFIEMGFTDDNQLIAGYNNATLVRTRVHQATYDASAHAWWRVREAAGVVYWETSANGNTWSIFTQVTWTATGWTAPKLDDMRVGFFAGNYNGLSAGQTFAIDNVNTAGASIPPALVVSPATLSFAANEGGTSPTAKTATVTNAGGGTLDVTVSDDAAWLTVTPSSPTVPSTLTIWPNVGVLTAGTYTATVTITATTPGATGSPKTIGVQFTVGPPVVVPPGAEPDSTRVYAMRTRSGDHKTEWVPVDELDL